MNQTPPVYKSQIETPTESFVPRYPWAVEIATEQQAIFWPAEELGVEEDEHDFRHGLPRPISHGVLKAQSVLTRYEGTIGGDEFWGGRIAKMFPRPEIIRMCACIANVELNSHAPFYMIGNEVIGVANDEFYSEWKNDPVLSSRIAFMNRMSEDENPLIVTSAITFLEGAVLFSIFGFFKSLNTRGHNFIPHFCAGIDASAKDENFHSLASAALFNVCRKERMENGFHTPEDDAALTAKIYEMAKTVYEHELCIIDLLFEQGETEIISKDELIDFLQDRINVCLNRLGLTPLFKKNPGIISSWFYKQLSSVKVPDLFAATQIQYRRDFKKYLLTFRNVENKKESISNE